MIRTLACLALLSIGYWAGYSATNSWWQAEMMRRAADETNAARTEEHRRNDAMNGVAANAQTELQKARADAAAASAAADRLRKELAASETRRLSAVAAERQARTDTAALYAELFRRADERAGELAAYADRSAITLRQCVAAYDAISNRKN